MKTQWESKTVYVAIGCFAFGGFNLWMETIKDPETLSALVSAIGAINYVLRRWFTKEPLQ